MGAEYSELGLQSPVSITTAAETDGYTWVLVICVLMLHRLQIGSNQDDCMDLLTPLRCFCGVTLTSGYLQEGPTIALSRILVSTPDWKKLSLGQGRALHAWSHHVLPFVRYLVDKVKT